MKALINKRHYISLINQVKRLLKHNSPYLFLIRFLASFFSLYLFFPLYRGVVGEGGKIHSSFFETHFNLISGFTRFLIGSAKFVLEAFGYHLYQKDYHSLQIGYSRGISVNPSCLGWAVISFWIAFVFANSGSTKHRLRWMTGGVIVIVALNIVRIALITLANHLNWSPVTSLDHHQTFNLASYVCIAILILCYISVQKKYERHQFAGKQTGNRLSAI